MIHTVYEDFATKCTSKFLVNTMTDILSKKKTLSSLFRIEVFVSAKSNYLYFTCSALEAYEYQTKMRFSFYKKYKKI